MTDLSEAAVLEIQTEYLTRIEALNSDLWQAAHEMSAEKVLAVGEELARVGNQLSVGAQTVIASAYWKDHS